MAVFTQRASGRWQAKVRRLGWPSQSETFQTRAAAEAYLQFLYSAPAQELAAQHYYRPFDQALLTQNADRFPQIPLVTVEEVFGSWADAHRTHFTDGAIFDQIFEARQSPQ